MCVEKLGKAAERPVRAWKLFYLGRGHKKRTRLTPLCWPGSYKTGQAYESEDGPGFHAFVRRADAYASRSVWMHPHELCVRAVMLYNARRGTIRGMDSEADGKAGWCAPRMKILPKSNV